MNVLIISDMEGVAGICRWEQVSAGRSGYEEGRRLYTEELNATVRGAFAGGAAEVVVMDCHGAGGDWSFNSLIPESLDARCEFVVQHEWTEYTELLEQGCDVALFVGQHARAGAERGVLSHTVSSTSWRNLRFNGTLVGEVGINAALCGTWGTPVALVTGDDVVCDEATELLGPSLKTLAVKRGLGRFSARHLSPVRARELLEEAAREAVENVATAPIYTPGAPCTIEVELGSTEHAAAFAHRANVTVTDPRTVEATADTWWDAWRAIYL
ncbi:M55 family metallopeptidase [Solirubrobacter ginsenosidimutans]|uniref:M55 family metallopeptidase n=1 Tax=Solirubrobacter ginsenosidimutans TaxID=490573 RepID=A0A9X3MYE3_9ACTN|nr:M55 family metallopeptidase [Solirubrobacter ginsenosidimutans]MDA0163610.1 M55 family metallopeptidase [Solirubrobacter ginsenosidimutans]